MPTLRKTHVAIWFIAAVAAVLLLSGSASDLLPVVGLAALSAHAAANLVFAARARRGRKLARAAPSPEQYQESTPQDLAEVFSQDGVGAEVDLQVRLVGPARGEAALKAPLTGAHCLGWSLRVELYRASSLGGDADYTPLVDTDALAQMWLQDGDTRIRVRSPVVLRGEHVTEELLSWKKLDGKGALKEMVDNSLQLAKLQRTRYTGVRVEETVVHPEDPVAVSGRASRRAGGELEVSGSGERGQPNPVFVFPRNPPAHPHLPAKTRVRLVANTAIAVAGLLVAAGLARQGSWWKIERSFRWANVERVGTLSWKGSPEGITLRVTTLDPPGPHSWTLDPDDEDVSLISGETDAVVRGSTQVSVERQIGVPFDLTVGTASYPEFRDGVFRLTLPGSSPVVEPSTPHFGYLQVVNNTGSPVEIRFNTPRKRTGLTGQYWTLAPVAVGNGGTYLVLDNETFNVTEGDGVLVRKPGGVDGLVILGADADAVWDADEVRWILTVKPSTLGRKTGTLVVRNPNPFEVVLSVMEGAAQKPTSSWTLEAGYGGEEGKALGEEGSPLQFRDGSILRVEPKEMEVIYTGEIRRYARATWEEGVWTLGP